MQRGTWFNFMLLGIAIERLTGKPLGGQRTQHSATRTLGWEFQHHGWSGGEACSSETIGHTGFTGTGLWIDFAGGLAWTLLTNRVHPTRHRDTGILQLRREAGDAIAGAAA